MKSIGSAMLCLLLAMLNYGVYRYKIKGIKKWGCFIISSGLIFGIGYTLKNSMLSGLPYASIFFSTTFLIENKKQTSIYDGYRFIKGAGVFIVAMATLSAYESNQEYPFEKAIKDFPTVQTMQEIVGEEMPITIKEDEKKINGKIAIKEFGVYPVDESQPIPIQYVFAKSIHSISRYVKDKIAPVTDTAIGELDVNGFTVQIDSTIKEDVLEIRYWGHNGKVVVSGYGKINNKGINEEDLEIIKDKVEMIVSAF